MRSVDATVLSSNPLYCGLFTAKKAAQDDGEKRLHLQNGEGCYTQHCAAKLDKKTPYIFRHWHFKSMSIYSASLFFSFLSSRFLPFHLLHLFFCHCIWVSRLSFPPPLFLPPCRPLISCFLLSILTQDWCALLRRCLPLKNWQPALLGRDIMFYYTLPILRPFSYSFNAWENKRRTFGLFTFSESQHSVTLNCFRLALLCTEVSVKTYTWRIAASYVTFEIPQDMSVSMNSLSEYGSSLLNVLFYKLKCKCRIWVELAISLKMICPLL